MDQLLLLIVFKKRELDLIKICTRSSGIESGSTSEPLFMLYAQASTHEGHAIMNLGTETAAPRPTFNSDRTDVIVISQNFNHAHYSRIGRAQNVRQTHN